MIIRLSLFIFDAVDRILRDIIYTNKLSGGIALLAGDFRQILPVVRLGRRPNIVDAAPSGSVCGSSVLYSSYIATCASRDAVMTINTELNYVSMLPGALCNSAIVSYQVTQRYLTAQIMCGEYSGNVLFIPWIQLSPVDAILAYTLRRKQFSVRPEFVMTINKAQGQTLQHAGVLPNESVFTMDYTVCHVIAQW